MSVESSAPPVSRTQYVVERLKEDVASGAIKPGELIKQTVLAKRYGVSATPVREALRMLEADGVVSYDAHKGASVREMTPDTARDLYRLRAAAERTAAEMAVERMTPRGLEEIRAAHAALAAAQSAGTAAPAELSVLNRAFHFAIYRQTSPLIVQHLELLWARFTPGTTVWRHPADAAELQADHDRILDAIERGDAEAAGRLTADHVARASRIREQQPDLRASGADETENFSNA
ncbi:GntR family transcriptional regulator [Rhodococcoides corynebacterioides]|uniref:GntR family transcriptional regulator n=1 Tax=Rhodococcoides corynebacterioides TaxID=53972 RepID=A0ABS7P0A7_9NOCA|nr:GntR family transcriptional regulator [Rhodococcus corynebacterioides]MBY6365819.1 GntR family transcriptional regulator [Rhodococcus corynebacterioides]MBY6408232.1 GntR family transcriptional regulator [Rhodococcus corynebacterioides]